MRHPNAVHQIEARPSAETTTINSLVKYISRWLAASTNCLDSTNIFEVAPTMITNWWVVSGPSNFTATGSGLSTSFTPTNIGSGSITFSLQYSNSDACAGGIQTVTKSKSFSIHDPVIATATCNFMDPAIHALNASGTQWDPLVATVALTAQLIYCGGESATIHITGTDLKPFCVTEGGSLLPADESVGLSGSKNWPESNVGNPSGPPVGVSFDYGDGVLWRNTGWGRWTVLTWAIDTNNCSGTLSIVQQHAP